MKKTFLLTLFIIAICQSGILAQKAVPAGVRTINAYCVRVDMIKKKSKSPDLVFADVSDPTVKADEKWRKFASEKALDKFREETETYSIAYNWTNAGRVVASHFTLSSPSGDWVEYLYYYFRLDGSVARVEIEQRTFNGDNIINQIYYFNAKGRQLHKTIRFRDLQTGKPKKATSDMIASAEMSDGIRYKNTGKLPFAHLLKKK